MEGCRGRGAERSGVEQWVKGGEPGTGADEPCSARAWPVCDRDRDRDRDKHRDRDRDRDSENDNDNDGDTAGRIYPPSRLGQSHFRQNRGHRFRSAVRGVAHIYRLRVQHEKFLGYNKTK